MIHVHCLEKDDTSCALSETSSQVTTADVFIPMEATRLTTQVPEVVSTHGETLARTSPQTMWQTSTHSSDPLTDDATRKTEFTPSSTNSSAKAVIWIGLIVAAILLLVLIT